MLSQKFILCALISTCIYALTGYSQYQQPPFEPKLLLGLNAGITSSFAQSNYSDRALFSNTFGLGIQYPGLVVMYQREKNLYLESGLHLVQKNHGVERAGFYEGIFYSYIDARYLQLPIGLRLAFPTASLQGFLSTGLYTGYWLSGKWDVAQFNFNFIVEEEEEPSIIDYYNGKYEFDNSYELDNRKDNRFDLGAYLGGGLQFSRPKFGNLWIEVRANHGLSQLDKFNGDAPLDHQPRSLRSLAFTMGYARSFSKARPARS